MPMLARVATLLFVTALAACGGGGSTPAYRVGGAVSGLDGTLVLQDNGTDTLSVNSNGSFSFQAGLGPGASYLVTIEAQPIGQTCSVAAGSGVVTADIQTVAISCTTMPLSLVSSSPDDSSDNVSRTNSIVLTFSAPLDVSTVNTTSVGLQSGSTAQTIAVSVNGSQLLVTPATTLMPLTTYQLTVGTAVSGSIGGRLNAPVVVTLTTADRSWGTPVAIESDVPAYYAYSPAIAVNASGDALVLWSKFDGTNYNIWSSWYTVTTSEWSVPSLVEANGLGASLSPQVAFDASGDALGIWEQGVTADQSVNTIGAKRYDVNSGWGSLVTIGNGAGTPRLATDPAGDAIAAWYDLSNGQSVIRSNRYQAGSGWGAADSVSDPTSLSEFPQVAMAVDGTAYLVWDQQTGGQPSNIWADQYLPGSGWQTPALLQADPDYTGYGPVVGMDASGDALAVWDEALGLPPSRIVASRFTPGGDWGPPATLATDAVASLQAPEVAVNGEGEAIAVWQRYLNSQVSLWASHYTPTTGWDAPVALQSMAENTALAQQVAIDSEGNALAVWQEQDGSAREIWANRYVAGQGWTGAARIETVTADATNPQVSFASDGRAYAVWEQADGSSHDIWAAIFQ